jgi:WD40 repeat protein
VKGIVSPGRSHSPPARERVKATGAPADYHGGVKIGPYEILGEIGRGGMGAVFRGRAPDGRDVAVKVLLQAQGTALERFGRERRLLDELREEQGFVPLLDFGTLPSGPFIVMPFVGGGTLRDRLHQGPLAIDETVALGLLLAKALGQAHARGIVHRDLKPENVLFTTDGKPLVTDLGLAKHFRHDDGAKSVSLSKTGVMVGTAGYMPPEQLNDAKSVGPPADVFALGAMLYECLTGHEAWEGDSEQERVMNVIDGNLVPVRNLRADTPRWLAAVIERALARTPEQRFADGAALASALAAREETGSRGRGLLVAGVAVAGLAVAGVAAVLHARGSPAPAELHARDAVSTATTPAPPPSPPAPRPARKIESMPLLAPLASNKRAKLVQVLGSHAFKHTSGIEAAAIAPDGATAASGSDDGVIRIWDLETETERRILRGHEAAVIGLDFSRDGKRLISAGGDGTARVWDVASGKELLKIGGFTNQVWFATFSPDGKRALTSGRDQVVRLHDLEAGGKTLFELGGHAGIVPTCSFSPDGKLGASASCDGVRVWDLEKGVLRALYTEHAKAPDWAIFTPDGKHILSGGWDPAPRLWEVDGLKTVRTFPGHTDNVRFCALTGDGARAFTVGKDRTVRLWDVATGRELWKRDGHRDWILAGGISRDGRLAFSGSADQTCRLWDLETPGGRDLTPEGHQGPVTALAVALDGKTVVSGGADGSVRAWELATSESSLVANGAGPVRSVSLSQDGRRLLAAFDASLALHDLGARRLVASLETQNVTCAALAPDGKRAAVGQNDGNVEVWDLEAKSLVSRTPGHLKAVMTVSFDRDSVLRTAGADRYLKLWNRQWTATIDGIPFYDEEISPPAAAFARDGRAVLVARTSKVQLWHIERHALDREIAGSDVPPATLVAISADASRGATASADGTVRLWDLATVRLLDKVDLGPTADTASVLEFTPDGKSLLVGTARGVVLRFEAR